MASTGSTGTVRAGYIQVSHMLVDGGLAGSPHPRVPPRRARNTARGNADLAPTQSVRSSRFAPAYAICRSTTSTCFLPTWIQTPPSQQQELDVLRAPLVPGCAERTPRRWYAGASPGAVSAELGRKLPPLLPVVKILKWRSCLLTPSLLYCAFERHTIHQKRYRVMRRSSCVNT